MLTHALLAFTSFEAAACLRKEPGAATAHLRPTWVDLVRRLQPTQGTETAHGKNPGIGKPPGKPQD